MQPGWRTPGFRERARGLESRNWVWITARRYQPWDLRASSSPRSFCFLIHKIEHIYLMSSCEYLMGPCKPSISWCLVEGPLKSGRVGFARSPVTINTCQMWVILLMAWIIRRCQNDLFLLPSHTHTHTHSTHYTHTHTHKAKLSKGSCQ